MPTATELSGKARRHLRALGHHLRPVVLVGKDGVSTPLVEATHVALRDHELIKVKLGENADVSRETLANALATQTGAAQVGLVGRVLLLYKRHPKAPKIELPGSKDGASKAAKSKAAKSNAAKRPAKASNKPAAARR